MTYKIDKDLLEKGTRELIKVAINNLESAITGTDRNIDVKAAVELCYSVRNAAIWTLVDHLDIDFYLSEHSGELKRRFGVDIK